MQRAIRWMLAIVILVGLLIALVPGVGSADDATIVKFEGTIVSRPQGSKVGTWVIDGREVRGVESTLLIEAEGPADPGAQVTVIAKRLTDGTLEAMVIRVQGTPQETTAYIAGFVSELGASHLVVNGLRIEYNAQTVIEGTLSQGAFVTVQARVSHSVFVATHIRVIPLDRDPVFEIVGVVRSMTGTTWVIGHHEVTVTAATRISGTVEVGVTVRARVTRLDDGSLVALEIEVQAPQVGWPEQVEINGAIESFPPLLIGRWVVAGQAVIVLPVTRIEGVPAVGRTARVRALRWPGGTLYATRITIEPGRREPIQFTGTIHFFTSTRVGIWRVDDKLVMVVPSTVIVGVPRIGAQATVTGYPSGDDDLIVATRIEIAEGAITPYPVPSPSPSTTPEGRLHITGFITEVGADYIVVNGFRIYYNAETRIEGELRVGRLAFVMARITPTGYLATDITTVETASSSLENARLK